MPAADTPSIPDKRYFKIGEVCQLTGVKQHVLRYWESEFRILHPQRAQSKQRLYRRADVETVLMIKKLLKDEGFTINGAKKALVLTRDALAGQERKQAVAAPVSSEDILAQLKSELLTLKNMLEE